MSKYSQRVDALEQNEKGKKRIFTVIVVVLVLLFLGGMIVGAAEVLGTEGTFDPYAENPVEPLSIKEPSEALLNRLFTSIDNAKDFSKVRISMYTDIDIPDDKIVSESGDADLVTQLKYVKSQIPDSFKQYYTIYEAKFGEDYSDKLVAHTFTADDTSSVECVRGKLDGEGKVTEYNKLFYTVEFPETDYSDALNSNLYESLGMDVSESVKERCLKDLSSIADVKDADISCSNFRITAQTDIDSGRINNICYIRGYSVTLTLLFKGDLAGFGEQTISFDFNITESHWYTWAGLSFNAHELRLEKRNVKAIEATRTADEEVELTWSSSNPEIASVDERGYIKCHAESAEPVIISAQFTYLGTTYTDSCTVYVRKPVTEIKVSQKALTMKNGDNVQLLAEVKPKSATIKDVLWFTEDENVATVDENGNITATGIGSTKVYAISADGFYRSSCAVTVTQEGGE